jgi:prepilin-type N-terminal cleavage/methylation domain-containing protein
MLRVNRFATLDESASTARGFTLIELLVVITIIVVLLALLTPALDKAIYESELAMCGTQARGIATGALVYAADQKRRYPMRDGIMEESSYTPDTLARDRRDDRARLSPYIGMKMMIDPMTEPVDLSRGQPGSLAVEEGGHFFATYHLFFGWRWRPQRGMDKVGDRFSYDWLDAAGNDKVYQFRFLAGDHDFIDQNGGSAHGSHPDGDGVMFNVALENQDWSSVSPVANAANAGRKLTISRWQSIETSQRGLIDMNFAVDDGSVQRYQRVRWDEGAERERFVLVPESTDNQLENFKVQLPTR